MFDNIVSRNGDHFSESDEVGKHQHILKIFTRQVQFKTVEILDALLDHIFGEIFESRFAGIWICAKQSGEVFTLGRKKELVRSDFCAILVFDYKIIKLIFFSFLMIQFYIVTELVTSRSHSDSYSSPRAACCGNQMSVYLVFHREAEKTKSMVMGPTRNRKTAQNIVKTEKSSQTEKLPNMMIKSANS